MKTHQNSNNETDLYLYYTDMDWGDLLRME